MFWPKIIAFKMWHENKLASPLAANFNEQLTLGTLCFSLIFLVVMMLKKVLKCIKHIGFAWNRKSILLGAKRLACIVSAFSNTSNVRVGLMLSLAYYS